MVINLLSRLQEIQARLACLMSARFAHSRIKNGLIKFQDDGFWTTAFEECGGL